MIARVPQLPEMYGQNMSNLRVFSEALPRESSGVFQVQNQFTGRSSIVAYRNVEDFPLIVTVALDRNEALAGWRRFVWVVALATFHVGALILLLYRSEERRVGNECVRSGRSRLSAAP